MVWVVFFCSSAGLLDGAGALRVSLLAFGKAVVYSGICFLYFSFFVQL